MARKERKQVPSGSSPGSREVYTRPELRELGRVGALTQSGSDNNAEMVDANGEVMGMMAAMMQRL